MKYNQVFEFIKKMIYVHAYACVYIYKQKNVISTSGNRISGKVSFHGNIEKQQGTFGVRHHFIRAC